MRWDLLLIVLMLVLLLLLCSAPGYSQDEDPIAYKPDIVGVGRMFMVALRVPTNAPEIKVTVPDSVEMFDRTPLPTKTELRKYYFRSLKPAKQADIVFAHPAGAITISLEIWSFEDLRQFRELKGVQLPRRWPLGEPLPELKQGQTITTDKLREYWQGKGSPGAAWLKLSDQEIWDLQPDCTIPRYHFVSLQHGCPVHGIEVYTKKAYYPWSFDMRIPHRWKLTCPIGGEEYPTNDFANGDMTSGEFPDDGFGGACEYEGNKYRFIAVICQVYCSYALVVAPECADGYMATDDMEYVHKALVAMSRVALEYAYLGTMTHHRHRNDKRQTDRLGPAPFSEGPCLAHSGLSLYAMNDPRLAEAYDKIFPVIEQDKEIIPFLQSKGLEIRTHEDLRRFIEENLFAVWLQGLMDGASHANEPIAQGCFARLAEVLNYQRGDELMDWLYDGAGKMRTFVTNGFFRDGAPYESTGGYNDEHMRPLGPIVDSIEHLRQMRPEVYPEERYPDFTKSRRYHNVFDFAMNTVNIDRTYPNVGDSGSFPQYQKLGKRVWQNGGVGAFEHAYKVFKDPKFAWALANHEGWEPSLEFPYTREAIEKEAAKWPNDWNDKSCLQDGYGLAMLRSGRDDDKRALWMYYGRTHGHAQDEIMQIGLDAWQSKIVGHMGCPRNWNHWETCWVTHNVARQIPFVQMTATGQLFADAGPVHIAEAYAEGFADEVDSGEGYDVLPDDWQRRMLVLVDVSDDQFYCVDFYRIHGGKDHWWTIHVQEGVFSTEGLELTRQEGGTVAGPEVPYGDPKWMEEHGCKFSTGGRPGWYGPMFAFPHLYNVERGTPAGVWSADWALKDADGLHFRMTVPQAEGAEVIIADGTSPAGGKPYEMKWVLMHKEGPSTSSGQAETPTKSQVVNVMELYNGEPVIKRVRPLEVSGGDEAGFDAYGCVIELADGRTDTIFASADGTVVRSAESGFEFAGRFGLYRERDGVALDMVLIGGTKLTKNGVGITEGSAEYRAEITAVDRDTETIIVAPAPGDLEALVGNYIYITNPVRRIAYKVLEAKEVGDGAELHLEFDSHIGVGKVSGVDSHKVLSSTAFPVSGYRYYHGARIVNAQRTSEYQLAGMCRGKFALIDSSLHPDIAADKLAAEFPVDSWFDVYDYGVGDEVVWPYAESVAAIGPAAYRVTGTDEFALSLP